MLDTEKKILEAFTNNEISLTSQEILDKMPKVKARRFSFKKIFACSSAALVLVASCLLVLLWPTTLDNGIETIEEKVMTQRYQKNLIGASNTLFNLNDSATIELSSNDEDENQLLVMDAYRNFESSAIASENEDKVNFTKEEFNKEYKGEYYEYKGIIENTLFNQTYEFYYSIDEDNNSLKGLLKEPGESIFNLFAVKVETTFTLHDNIQYADTTYTPTVFNQEIPYTFRVKENVDGKTSYNYYLADEELFGFDIMNKDGKTHVLYKAIYGVDYEFVLTKVEDNKYDIEVTVFEMLSGNFTATYDLETRNYDLEFNSFEFNYKE